MPTVTNSDNGIASIVAATETSFIVTQMISMNGLAVGLQSKATIVTGAALIMMAVFGGDAPGRLVPVQHLGFELDAVVLIVDRIIRSMLVPSAMALRGDRHRCLPCWLA